MSKFTNAMRKTGSVVVHTDLADVGHGVAKVSAAPVRAAKTKVRKANEVRKLVKTMRNLDMSDRTVIDVNTFDLETLLGVSK